jgi:Concanavalin A-like lectin/glucanases superfamily/PEP-CTERM motif
MRATRVAMLAFGVAAGSAFAAPSPVAQYGFNNTLTSSVGGAPALTVTDPLSQSGFTTDTVFGNTQQVWSFAGLASPVTDQAGLTLNTTGLLTQNNVYSLELVFKFTQGVNAWRRIVDVSSRSTDNGFYVDPSNNLDVFPIGGGSAFTNNVYHDVFLVDNAGVVTFYLDGSAQANLTTTVMDIDSSNNINLFLDNVVGGGQGEFSNGSIASLRLYNEALTAVPPPPVPPVVPGVPEPETYALMLVGLGALATVSRRRRR